MVGIYFSGTGNTKYCVERFLKGFGDGGKMFSVEEERAAQALGEEKDILFAYPIYYSNFPAIVRDFIENNSMLWNGKNVFILITMGMFSGDGAGLAGRLLGKYGANITGGLHLTMPDCISDVKLLKHSFEDNLKMIEAAARKTDKAVGDLKAGKAPREGLGFLSHMAGLFGQRLWFARAAGKYRTKLKIDPEKCTGCGKCVALCPVKNLRLSEGKAVAGGKCTLCYRCVNACCQEAATLLGKKVVARHDMQVYKKRIKN